MPWLAFGLALIISLLFIPILRWVSFRLRYVAEPRQDRWHHKPTPVLGGIGLFLAFLVAVFLSWLVGGRGVEIRWGLLAGSFLVFLLGLYDDFKPVTPPVKLVGQILAATVVVFLGYTTDFFTPRIPNNVLAQIPNILLTYIWLIGITNAINLLDNMDGLAGGLSLIAAFILSFFFWRSDNQSLLLVSTALGGSVLGFLIFNFPPASIFMGDSGSLFLGFTLAVLAIARLPQASNVFAVMGVPTLLFLLPILDTILVTFTRLLRGQSPILGGRDHTSHRLIAFGLSERQALLVLYAVALGTGVLAAALESINYWFSLVLVPALVLSLTLLIAYLGGLKVIGDEKVRNSKVAPFPVTNNGRAITRFMLDLTYKRRLLEIILDFFLIAIAYYLAFLLGFDLSLNLEHLNLYLTSLPLAWAGAYLSVFAFGVYRGLWRYVGVDDLVRYLKAGLGGAVLAVLGIVLLFPARTFPAVIFILFPVFLFLGLAASRSSFKVLDQIFTPLARGQEERILICGAGDAGEMALRWIIMNPQLGYRPAGFLDDDAFKAGRQIHGVAVLGQLNQLDSILSQELIDGVIVTVDAITNSEAMGKLVATCHTRGKWVRNLRFEFELVE